MNLRICIAIAALALAAGLSSSGGAGANAPKPEITRKVISEHEIAGTNRVLQLVSVEIPVGAESAPHVHTAVALNYIIAGSVESRFEGEPAKRYNAGDTYQDPANKKHLEFKNVGAEPLKLILAVEVEKGQPFMRVLPPEPK
jgi:quercetin dioxygenase-like cupin family protein